MRTRLLTVLMAALTLAAVNARPAAAQAGAVVRVVSERATLMSRNSAKSSVLASVDAGTTLDVLDRADEWYWILVPPDADGTRRSAWVSVNDVEVVKEPVRRPTEAEPLFKQPQDRLKERRQQREERRAQEKERRLQKAKGDLEKAKEQYEKLTQSAPANEEPATPPADAQPDQP